MDKKSIFTAYSPESDMTFIMEETDKVLEVKGFYFGEPNADDTKTYNGKLSCIIENEDS